MAIVKFLVAAIAVAGTALAQTTTTGPCKGSVTIASSADATSALSSCSVYQGDITISEHAAGTLSLDGVQRITGSLSCDGAVNLTTLEANDLVEIDKEFSLSGLTILSTLTFPSLQKVDTINWIALPALQQLAFTDGVSMASNVTISNTQLNTLDGISLKTVGLFNVNNNPYLTDISLPLANITNALNLAANSHDLKASFPNLEFAFNMTFRNCSSVSLPALATVNGSLGFYSNSFQSFTGPNLTATGNDLVFDDNTAMTNVTLPKLKTVGGGFQIANNTLLKVINGFKNLQTIAGALDFSGNFTNVTLPALKDVRGGFNMQTSATFDCSAFDSDHSSGVVKGTYVCTGNQEKPGTAGTTPTSSGSSPSATKKSAAGRFEVNVPTMMGIATIVGGLLHLAL